MGMQLDLGSLSNEGTAAEMAKQLLTQLEDARHSVELSQRRAVGFRKMLDGLIEMFPALEDLLPEDLDGEEQPRPRGAEAVRRALAESPGDWYAVPAIVMMLQRHDWLPESSNPANAVRTAAERCVEDGRIEKGRSQDGAVIYRFAAPPTYAASDEEPF